MAALTTYQQHVQAYARAYPKTRGAALMTEASKTWRKKARPAAKKAAKAAKKAAKAAEKATGAVAKRSKKRVVGYDRSKVRVVAVKKGAHHGGKHGTPIGRGLYRLTKNPGEFADRVKQIFSTDTVGTIVGASGGVVAAVAIPMILGTYNEGGKGVLFSALATAIAAGGAAIIFPAAVIPIAAGGGIITIIRGLVVFVPQALDYFLRPLIEWSGANKAGPPKAGPAAGWRGDGRQAGWRGDGTQGDAGITNTDGQIETVEQFGNAPISY